MAIRSAQISTDRDFTIWGDSLPEGSSGGVVEAQRAAALLGMKFSPPRLVCNRGVGGETSTQILARITAVPANPRMGQLFWMCRNDPGASISQATSLANVAAAVAWCGHTRYRVISVPAKTDGTEESGAARTALDALNAALFAANPNNFIDISALNGVANNALRGDGLHFTAPGQLILVNTYFYPSISAL